MIALAHVERAAVGLDALDDRRDHHVRIRIPVAVGVRAQVIREQVTAYLKELRDGFSMVARYARRKILRSLDAAGGGLDRQAGDGNRRARTAGIRVQNVLAHVDLFGRIGVLDVHLRYIGGYIDGVDSGSEPGELQVHDERLTGADFNRADNPGEPRRNGAQFVASFRKR